MKNRKTSKSSQQSQALVARAWQARRRLLLMLIYLGIFAWLFTALYGTEVQPVEVYQTPNDPAWEKPGREHWFGTTGTGLDLFGLSRVAFAHSVALSVVASLIGVGLTFFLVMAFAFDPGEKRFSLFKSLGRGAFLLPVSLVVLIVLAGAGGSVLAFLGVVPLLIVCHLTPRVTQWFEEGESRSDATAARVLGLSRRHLVRNRIVPEVLRKLIGIFLMFVPQVALLEMGVSFLGLSGDYLSVGGLIAYGQEVIIEAPWLAIAPGVFASVGILILTVLALIAMRMLRVGSFVRFL